MTQELEQRFCAARRDYIASRFSRMNPRQLEAVLTTEGPLLLLAGAGSGKTTVLIHRIANLIRYGCASDSTEVPPDAVPEDIDFLEEQAKYPTEEGVQRADALCALRPAAPWSILAITFTNKAANELRERLTDLLGPEANDVWAMTFHSACCRILRREIERLGYDRSFTIYDTADSERVMKDLLRERGLDEKTFPPRAVLAQISRLKVYADDKKAQQEFMNIKYQNKVRLAKYILEHNGIEVDPRSIFDVQVKRLHEYKRQLLNILHVMHLYNELKEHPELDFYPRTFIFGAKAAAGYRNAKLTIKLINSVADVVNNDPAINGKIKVVFIENYNVSNAEIIFAAADVSEQISTASKEASGTGNMKFMLNGALTLGTMDGANVEIVEEVGEENAFIFGLSAQEVINYENHGGYDPMEIFNNDQDVRKVLMQLINGTFAPGDPELFRPLYNSLLNTQCTAKADTYFILKDFMSYHEAHMKINELYQDQTRWAHIVMMNTACSGKFTSDRTIQQYVDEIWELDKVTVEL